MVHLLHRLYGVDAPGPNQSPGRLTISLYFEISRWLTLICFMVESVQIYGVKNDWNFYWYGNGWHCHTTFLFGVAAAIPAVLFLAQSFPTFPNFQPHTFIPHCTCCDNHIPHACILLNARFSFTKWCWKCVCSSLCCFDLDLPAAGGQGSDDFAEPLHDNRVCKL